MIPEASVEVVDQIPLTLIDIDLVDLIPFIHLFLEHPFQKESLVVLILEGDHDLAV
tara:strand:- start:257 stop:424 length:168 start_codon:yes stop_codon:yes gene_type:complete